VLKQFKMSAEIVFQSAVDVWWQSKSQGAENAKKSQGAGRDQNLSGKTMDGFRVTICKKLGQVGVDENDIFFGSALSRNRSAILPSYYRPTKNWDVVVCKNSFHKRLAGVTRKEAELIAAVEFKSQFTSIGNNQNNRMEESLGVSEDFWAAYEAKTFRRLTPRPWLGYLFVGVYEEDRYDAPVRLQQPHFQVDPIFAAGNENGWSSKVEFDGPSYAYRYRIFLERMLAKKRYDGACFITTNADLRGRRPNYNVLFPEFSGERFLDQLTRHVKAYYHD
jgi:hypothetical protein